MNRRPAMACCSLGLAVAIIAGCTHDGDDLHQWVAVHAPVRSSYRSPAPASVAPTVSHHADEALRDPFSLPLAGARLSANATGPHPDRNRQRQPLEAYALDSLTMVGSIRHGNSVVALVAAPDDVIHRVVAGEYLGRHDGRVSHITPAAVALVELVRQDTGGWHERHARLPLRGSADSGAAHHD